MNPTLHRLSMVAVAAMALAATATSTSSAQAATRRPAKATTNAVTAPAAASSREAELLQKLDRLSGELESVKAQLVEVKQQQAQQQQALQQQQRAQQSLQQAVQTTPDAAQNGAQNGTASQQVVNGGEASGAANASGAPATVFTSYGEINYNHYNRDKSKNEADLRRFVLGLQHRFDARTKLVTELEVEHAVTSSADDDPGEVAMEQAYVERELTRQWALRAGLFLMPSGLLNENHEPTAYYGVERNFVETAIIPSTWREGGVQFIGSFDNGLTLQTGLSTGFRLAKWEFDNPETAESPLGSVHQELAQAHAKDPAVFVALNWRGMPGLQLGGSWFAGNANQGELTPVGNGLRVTLWDLHARYEVAGFDLSALYAKGTIGGTVEANTANLSSGPDWFAIPQRFDGAYVQAAYKLWSSGDLSLSPFARIERFNTRRSYADLGTGTTPDGAPTERVYTLGANLNVGQGVVFKVDVQRFKEDTDKNRVDLGVGWSF